MIAPRLLIFAACGLAGFFETNAMVAHRSAGPETLSTATPTAVVAEMPMPSITESALVAEWEQMRSQYGREPADLPTVYLAVKNTKDAFRRRAFRAALLAEWAVTDPRSAQRNHRAGHAQPVEWRQPDGSLRRLSGTGLAENARLAHRSGFFRGAGGAEPVVRWRS